MTRPIPADVLSREAALTWPGRRSKRLLLVTTHRSWAVHGDHQAAQRRQLAGSVASILASDPMLTDDMNAVRGNVRLW